MSKINLLDHEVWKREKGYWFGEYTFLNAKGLVNYNASNDKTSGQFDYRKYYGFISLQIDGSQLKQRNIFIRPALDLELKDLNNDGTISINELNKFGFTSSYDYTIDLGTKTATAIKNGSDAGLDSFNYTEGTEKTFTANQTAVDNSGGLSGSYFGIPTTTKILGNHTVIYTVGTDNTLFQNQLTTLPGNNTRIRTAQGLFSGSPTYSSFYRETKFQDILDSSGNITKSAQQQFYEKFYEYRTFSNVPVENQIENPEKFFHTGLEDVSANPPTGINFSVNQFNENIPSSAIVASLSTLGDQGDSHSYELVSGEGDTDNSFFKIEGNKLKIKESPNYENKSSYLIRLQTVDGYGNKFPEKNIFSVNNLNESNPVNNLESNSLNETINGISGTEQVVKFSGNFSDYSFVRSTNSLIAQDQRTGINDGNDTLKNIEFLQFTDQIVEESKVDVVKTYAGNFIDYKFYSKGNGVYQIKTDSGLDDITGYPSLRFTGEVETSSFRDISAIVDVKGTFDQVTGIDTDDAKMFRLYNAAFKRLPDPDGLKYWIEQCMSENVSKKSIASSFLASAEFKQRYGENVSNAKYVETLYTNVLGRNYDQEGYNYWLGNLNNGTETRYELLLGFSESTEHKVLFTEMTGFG